jgi:hypothetical protein
MTSSHADQSVSVIGLQHLTTDDQRLTTASLVRNHPQNFAEISIANQSSFPELPFRLRFLRRQNVTQFRMSPLHLSRRRLLEALGSAFVRFQFRHKNPQKQLSALSLQLSSIC